MRISNTNNLPYQHNNTFKATSPQLMDAIEHVYYTPIQHAVEKATVKRQIVDKNQIQQMYNIYQSMKEKAAQFLQKLPEWAVLTCHYCWGFDVWTIEHPLTEIIVCENPSYAFKSKELALESSIKSLLLVDANQKMLDTLKNKLERHIDSYLEITPDSSKRDFDESDFSKFKSMVEQYLNAIDELARLSHSSQFSPFNYRFKMQKKADDKIAEVRKKIADRPAKQKAVEEEKQSVKKANLAILSRYPK